MATQMLDPHLHHFDPQARQIMAHVPTVVAQWGLLPKFMRWRLTQDPGTGLVVLFGVLNDKYIARHTQTPFGDYFDPRLLHDLATDLQVQVVPSNSDGLRYAFILDWGQLGKLPAREEFPGLQRGKLLVAVTFYGNKSIASAWDSHTLVAPGDSPASVAEAPAVLAAVEAEVERRRALYHQLPGYPESLFLYNAAALGSGLCPLPRLLLVPEECTDLLESL